MVAGEQSLDMPVHYVKSNLTTEANNQQDPYGEDFLQRELNKLQNGGSYAKAGAIRNGNGVSRDGIDAAVPARTPSQPDY